MMTMPMMIDMFIALPNLPSYLPIAEFVVLNDDRNDDGAQRAVQMRWPTMNSPPSGRDV